MITQDSRMYKFIQFKFHKAMCDYFNKIREIKREPELKTLECDILNPDRIINLEIKNERRTSNI